MIYRIGATMSIIFCLQRSLDIFFRLMILKILSLVLYKVYFFFFSIQRKSSVRLNFAKAKSSRLSNLATPFVRISMCHADRNIFNSLVYPYSITHTFFFCNTEYLTEYVTPSLRVIEKRKKKKKGDRYRLPVDSSQILQNCIVN